MYPIRTLNFSRIIFSLDKGVLFSVINRVCCSFVDKESPLRDFLVNQVILLFVYVFLLSIGEIRYMVCRSLIRIPLLEGVKSVDKTTPD